MIRINQTKKASIDAALEKPGKTDAKLDESQVALKKVEISALVKSGKTDEAITQLMELIL